MFAKTRLRYKSADLEVPLESVVVPTFGDEGDLGHRDIEIWEGKLSSDEVLPPIIVEPVDGYYRLWDGRHRVLSERFAGSKKIPAKIRPGGSK